MTTMIQASGSWPEGGRVKCYAQTTTKIFLYIWVDPFCPGFPLARFHAHCISGLRVVDNPEGGGDQAPSAVIEALSHRSELAVDLSRRRSHDQATDCISAQNARLSEGTHCCEGYHTTSRFLYPPLSSGTLATLLDATAWLQTPPSYGMTPYFNQAISHSTTFLLI